MSESPFSIQKAVRRFRESGRRLPDLEETDIAEYLKAVNEIGGADYMLLSWAHIETGADASEFHTSGRQSEGREYHPLTVRMCKLVDIRLSRIRFMRSKTRGRGAIEREVPVTEAFARCAHTSSVTA